MEVQAKLFQPLRIFKHQEKCRIVQKFFLTTAQVTSETHNLDSAAPKLLTLIIDVTDEQFNTMSSVSSTAPGSQKWLNKYLRNERMKKK